MCYGHKIGVNMVVNGSFSKDVFLKDIYVTDVEFWSKKKNFFAFHGNFIVVINY
jgi:hypothetical protein